MTWIYSAFLLAYVAIWLDVLFLRRRFSPTIGDKKISLVCSDRTSRVSSRKLVQALTEFRHGIDGATDEELISAQHELVEALDAIVRTRPQFMPRAST